MIRLSDRGRIAVRPVLSSLASAKNRRHHAIRQGHSEGSVHHTPADRTIALVEGRLGAD